jgi:hypothetical protein
MARASDVAGRAALFALAVALAGCGGSPPGRAPAAAPTAAARTAATAPPYHLHAVIPAAQARRLDAGAVGVIGFDLHGAVAPARLMVNKEQTLEGVRWSGWGGASATGRARVRTLVCDPTCAQGRLQRSAATIVLSGRRRCGRRRFYTSGRLTYLDLDTRRTLGAAVFLWPPHRPAGGAPASSTCASLGADAS